MTAILNSNIIESDITDLVLVVSGEIVESNFSEVALQITNQISLISEELDTEDDFKNAEKIAKNLRSAKKQLVDRRENALKQAEDLYAEFALIEKMENKCDEKALALEKLVKAEKKRKRDDMVDKSYASCERHYDAYCDSCPDFNLSRPKIALFHWDEYQLIIKGCSSFDSMQKRLIKQAAEIQADTDEAFKQVCKNAKIIDDAQQPELFMDRRALLLFDIDHLRAEVQGRLARFEAEELKRKQAEAERLAEEERAASLKTPEVSETVASEVMQQQDQIIESRPPVADAQDINKNPDLTGGSDQGNSQAVQTGAINQAESFLMQVQIVAERDDAITVAQLIEKQFSDDDRVVKIKLGRGQI